MWHDKKLKTKKPLSADTESYKANFDEYAKEVNEERISNPRKVSWNAMFFGVHNPSLKIILKNYSLLFVMFSGLFTIWIDFAPNNTTKYVGMFIGVIAGLVWLIWQALKTAGNEEHHYGKLTTGRKLLVILGLPAGVFYFIWSVFSYTLPYFYTKALGAPYVVSTSVLKTKTASKKSCNYRITSIEISPSMPGYICISRYEYLSGSDNFTLTGEKSMFGINFSDVYIADEASGHPSFEGAL